VLHIGLAPASLPPAGERTVRNKTKMKIIISRKGFDSKYGKKPSIILPDNTMLSFPIPVNESERGTSTNILKYKGKSLTQIFNELGIRKKYPEGILHVDPDIQTFDNRKPTGAFGQIGKALKHLLNCKVTTGDVFLFYGTFCETTLTNNTLNYKPMHPFHTIWGYLIVDKIFPISQDGRYSPNCKHPHILNKDLPKYCKDGNYLYIGKDFGTFTFKNQLRLTKFGYKTSYWSLPKEFKDTGMTCNDLSSCNIENGRIEFTSTPQGQEFVIDNSNGKINQWLKSILSCKV
jgi:hypothetical protein